MVIEVSKEIDVRRIGIDRYSLKTGLNLRVSVSELLDINCSNKGLIFVL